MEIKLNRKNNALHFEGSSMSSDVKVHIDGPENAGGEKKGSRPMELVLMALGSCSVFDLSIILEKQRQKIEDIQVKVSGKRRDEIPTIFTDIHISFQLRGEVNIEKANKAAELAVKKYCSVHDMLTAGGVNITYSIDLG